MKERETLISLLERLSGNRVHYGVNAIGGVRRDLTEELAAELRRACRRSRPCPTCRRRPGQGGRAGFEDRRIRCAERRRRPDAGRRGAHAPGERNRQ